MREEIIGDARLHMTGATVDECWPLVRDFHYSKRLPSASTHCFAWREPGGLFGDTGRPLAVAMYGGPVNRNWPQDALELQRLVRREDFNGKLSEFVSWSLRWLRTNTTAPFCLSYADTGEGHHGGIYQATNWTYTRSTAYQQNGFYTPQGYVHGRSCNSKYGTRSVPKIAEINPDWIPKWDQPKHLYVFPLRKNINAILRKFEWERLPYPKNNAARPVDEPFPKGVSYVQPVGAAP